MEESSGGSVSGATAGAGLAEAQAALEFWKAFDLLSQKESLDSSCVDMRENKTASIAGRKRLNDSTKAFRARAKEEQVEKVGELLKCYQEEIDQLSRRCKYCETTFFSLYKALYEAPDPAESIAHMIELVSSGSVNQLQIERLEGEIRQYEEEFTQLKNQDITIRRLEDQLQEFREQNEEKIAEEVSKRVAAVETAAELRISEAAESQRSAERRHAEAVDAMQLAEQSADRAQSQLYEVSSLAEKRLSALQNENAMLAEGAQRLQLKIVELETEVQHAQQQQQQQQQQLRGGSNSSSAREDLDTLQLVVSKLRDELSDQDDALRAEKQRTDALSREHAQLLLHEREQLQQLQKELEQRPSKQQYAALKKQLKVVQRIAFNVEDEDAEDEGEVEPETSLGERGQLEALLTARLKSLEVELSQLRRELRHSQQQEATAKETIDTLEASLEAGNQLISKLENELEARSAALEESIAAAALGFATKSITTHYNRNSSNNSSSNSDAANIAEGAELAQLLGVTASHNDASITTSAAVDAATDATAATVKSTTPTAAATGSSAINLQMINILQSQRDSYKERLTRAETSLQQLQNEIESSRGVKEQLQADNLALYSKIRFLQSYQSNNNNNNKQQHQLTPHRNNNNNNNSGGGECEEDYLWDRAGSAATPQDIESRYNSLYEQRMNPFDQFSHHERQRKMRDLPVADRIVLNTAVALVSNVNGRRFLMVYLGLMHLLVFGIIYYSTHHVHGGCDPSLDHLMSPAAAAAVAAKAAPDMSPAALTAVAGTVLHR